MSRRGLRWLLRRLSSPELCDAGGPLIIGSSAIWKTTEIFRPVSCRGVTAIRYARTSGSTVRLWLCLVRVRRVLFSLRLWWATSSCTRDSSSASAWRHHFVILAVCVTRTPAGMHGSSLWTTSWKSWCCLRRVARTSGVYASRCWLLFSRANFVPLAFMVVPLLK